MIQTIKQFMVFFFYPEGILGSQWMHKNACLLSFRYISEKMMWIQSTCFSNLRAIIRSRVLAPCLFQYTNFLFIALLPSINSGGHDGISLCGIW